MLVKDVMTKKVVFCLPGDTISSVLGKMEKHCINQLPVLFDDEVVGMITLSKIIKHDAPLKTKVKSLMIRTPVIGENDNVDKAIELILSSGLRALPVFDKKITGIISEEDILSVIDVGEIKEKKCIYANENDDIATVRKLMQENDISRVPVLGRKGFVGIVRSRDMIKLLRGKQSYESHKKGLGARQSVRIDETPVKTFMSKISETKPQNVMKALQKSGEAIVGTCIVTPKDVLRRYIKTKQRPSMVSIVGLTQKEMSLADEIHREAEKLIEKISHSVEVQAMKIHVERRHSKGRRTKYSISIQLPTQVGTFISTKSYGWDLLIAIQGALKKVEREFWKKYKRIIEK